MYRSRAYRRFQRRRAIHHKRMILRDYWRLNSDDNWTPVKTGMLDKGKVHCSCWMCRRKSYDEPRIMDRRKALSQQEQMDEMEVAAHGSLYSPAQTDQEAAEGASP